MLHVSRGLRRLKRYGLSHKVLLESAAISRMVHGGSRPINDALQQLRDIAVTSNEPGPELYKDAVKIYNPAYSDEHPAFVALPKNTEDIKRCLQVANKTGVPVVVKSGGHCFAGYSSTDSNGFVIYLKNMNEVHLKGNTVTVQAGASWGDVYCALDDTGYVAVGGCVPAVGIGGYILGGGYSMLSRAYGGLACDKAMSFTMVTADGGKVVTASPKENEDLFWALKGGGGGNFGILVDVISLEVCARPNKFIWTRLIYDTTDQSKKGLDSVGKNLHKLPKELNLDMALHGYFGKKVLTLDAVYSDVHEAKVLSSLENLHPPVPKKPQKFTSYLQFTKEYSKRHGFVHQEVEPIYVKGVMIDTLPPSLAKYFADLDIPKECLLEFVHMVGDISQHSATSTAFAYRSAQYSFYTYGRFHDPKQRDEVSKFATSTYNAVHESGCALGSYVNYMDHSLKNWAENYYGVNYPRLCEVKRKWNPVGQGSLHFQQEIGSPWEP
ncbi:LOW QUALITY PROTEIN: uncharacterized protein LOC114522812 [Dendronephthya gigantea]|uniref:LOW QUALITY PROTEIN: uncharacterized protein LOC114522812 n=1 Tax=Dendronephthya gigantea TaxID=151771 RepID=UPI00106B9F6A|nr:LOW QUALITY PROTEIN: uncharacterized protein LOC114522812 [Dendronephthya gigantea]